MIQQADVHTYVCMYVCILYIVYYMLYIVYYMLYIIHDIIQQADVHAERLDRRQQQDVHHRLLFAR
jgi:hypothetical protein